MHILLLKSCQVCMLPQNKSMFVLVWVKEWFAPNICVALSFQKDNPNLWIVWGLRNTGLNKVYSRPSASFPDLGEIWLHPNSLTSFNLILMNQAPSQPSCEHAHPSLLTFPWLLQFLPCTLPSPDEIAAILQDPVSSLLSSLLLFAQCFNFTVCLTS